MKLRFDSEKSGPCRIWKIRIQRSGQRFWRCWLIFWLPPKIGGWRKALSGAYEVLDEDIDW